MNGYLHKLMTLYIKKLLEQQINVLLKTIEDSDFNSYDYMDYWTTCTGVKSKQLAYQTEPYGHIIFSIPILICELWFPFLRKPFGIKKTKAPIVIAHHGLACLEMLKKTKKEQWLELAKRDAERLVSLSVPDAKGLCWGFPFTWSSNSGVIAANQPAATQSAYAFDLFEKLWNITNDDIYFERFLSVAQAMDEEYIDIPHPDGLVSTYHGRGYGDVVMNALSYRVHILSRTANYGIEKYKDKAHKLLSYLLSQQRSDGSWYYGESAKNRFIDNYHTCFVLKNLTKVQHILDMEELSNALKKGFGFYWNKLVDKKGLPKPYAQSVRVNIVKYELYDFAEFFGLFALLGPKHGFTQNRLNTALKYFLNSFWISGNTLRFRIYKVPTITRYSYYRFGMSAALYSISQLINSHLLDEEK